MFTGLSDKRQPTLIFVFTRSLAYDHERSIWVPTVKDSVGPSAMETARFARLHDLAEFFKRTRHEVLVLAVFVFLLVAGLRFDVVQLLEEDAITGLFNAGDPSGVFSLPSRPCASRWRT